MHIEVPYKSLKHTLEHIKIQVRDSLPFISQYIPKDIKSTEELFYFLKDITTYKNDPKNVELLQTVQTLMARGGKGDCDCFTILVLTCCIYLDFAPQQVVLVGNKRSSPSHIYTLVYDKKRKKMCSMDLTNPNYDTQRSYKFKQILDFMMTLRLEDGGFASKSTRKAKKAVKKEGKQKRVVAKQNKKTARKVGHTNRVVSRQENRTATGGQRRLKKLTKAKVKTGRQDKKLIRVKGKQAVIQARSDAKIDQIQNRALEPSNEYEGSMLPDEGGDYDEEGGGEYSDYEMMPDEEGQEEELSGPAWDVIKGAGKGIISQVKGQVKSKLPVNQSASQIKLLQAEKKEMQTKLDAANRNTMIFSGLSLLGGAGFVYFIKK